MTNIPIKKRPNMYVFVKQLNY